MNTLPVPPPKTDFSFKQLAAVAVGVMLLTAAGAALAVKICFFPQPFKPVELNQQEEQRLKKKLEQLAPVQWERTARKCERGRAATT